MGREGIEGATGNNIQILWQTQRFICIVEYPLIEDLVLALQRIQSRRTTSAFLRKISWPVFIDNNYDSVKILKAVPKKKKSTSVYDLKRMITSRNMFCVPLADKGELAGAKGCKKCSRKNPTKTKNKCDVEAFSCRTAENVIFIDTKIHCL